MHKKPDNTLILKSLPKKCQRCEMEFTKGYALSFYNEQWICRECKKGERDRSDHDAVQEQYLKAIKHHDYNFPLAGL